MAESPKLQRLPVSRWMENLPAKVARSRQRGERDKNKEALDMGGKVNRTKTPNTVGTSQTGRGIAAHREDGFGMITNAYYLTTRGQKTKMDKMAFVVVVACTNKERGLLKFIFERVFMLIVYLRSMSFSF